MSVHRKIVSDRGSTAFNSVAYALSAVALFLIVLLIVGCEIAISVLERAYDYFEAKEYSWLLPGGNQNLFTAETQRAQRNG